MAGWHHRCNGHELRQTLGDGEGQEGLVCRGSQRAGHNWATEQQEQSPVHKAAQQEDHCSTRLFSSSFFTVTPPTYKRGYVQS